MVENILPLFKTVFAKCAEWTDTLLSAVGGKGVVLAAFIIVLVVGLLFIPLRGFGLNLDMGGFGSDLIRQVTYKGKYANKNVMVPDRNYKGKYEKRSAGGHRASPK